MEGADIYQIGKNCRTSVEMIEKYYAAHIKTNLDAAAINIMRPKPKKKGQIPFRCLYDDSCQSPAKRAWRNGRR